MAKRKAHAMKNEENFICSIITHTCNIMFDPVVAQDGNTYERVAVVEWLKDHANSLIDNITPISVDRLFDNRALKNQIEEFIDSGDCNDEMKEDYYEAKKRLTKES